MKKVFLIGIISILSLVSCVSLFDDPADEYLLKAGNGLEYLYSDFELYDSSTHIFYFNTNHPEFKSEKSATFSLLANGEEIYNGIFWPSYFSSLPQGPFITTSPSFYPDYAFRIELITLEDQPADSRNDPRLISSLKKHNLLHSGLSGEIKDIVIEGLNLTFTITITNRDNISLLLLDPKKTGTKLFHYFTNAPVFYNITQKKVFSFNTEYQAPSPWDSWSKDWLSELHPGESIQLTFNYTINSALTPGDYKVSFEFPGLSGQITSNQLFQGKKRIWLGDIPLTKRIKIH